MCLSQIEVSVALDSSGLQTQSGQSSDVCDCASARPKFIDMVEDRSKVLRGVLFNPPSPLVEITNNGWGAHLDHPTV